MKWGKKNREDFKQVSSHVALQIKHAYDPDHQPFIRKNNHSDAAETVDL